jgi:MerR family transcriptional regulator/heat shock protein HspR
MTARYVKLVEVIEQLGVDRDWLRTLEVEEFIHPKRSLDDDEVLSIEDVERIRVVRLLTEEMDINLAGAEVILHMRETMRAMQTQFDEILATLVAELRERLKR